MSLLEQDTTKKRQMNKLFPKPEPEFDAGNNKKYEVKIIKDSVVYTKEAKRNLPNLYYLVSWKDYLKEESTWEPVMHLQKMISIFYKDYSKKQTVIFFPLNSAPSMTKPSVKLSTKQKQSHLTGSMKQIKKWDIK